MDEKKSKQLQKVLEQKQLAGGKKKPKRRTRKTISRKSMNIFAVNLLYDVVKCFTYLCNLTL